MESNVLYFRYQANGEDDGGWTVVDASVTSAVTDDDVTALFVQSSADGVVWSVSERAVQSVSRKTEAPDWSGHGITTTLSSPSSVTARTGRMNGL